MKKLATICKNIVKDFNRPQPPARRFFRLIFIFNPLLTVILVLILNGAAGFLHSCAICLTISTIIGTLCWSASYSARGVYILTRRVLKRPVRAWPVWMYLVFSFGFMPVALQIAFRVVEVGSAWIGRPIMAHNSRESLLIGYLIAGIFLMHRLHVSQKQRSELRIERAENARLRAQISAFTAQMNPHLLFNALNTITSLITSEPEKAEDMVINLADLYRKVLEASRTAEHSLSKELDICHRYLNLEKRRFGERLTFSLNIDPHIQPDRLSVPALTLQPLIENAVRHGIGPRASGGHVSLQVFEKDQYLAMRVDDDGVGFGQSNARPGAGVGLTNCRQRLALSYGERSVFEILPKEGGGTTVHLQIPLQISTTSRVS